MNKMGFGFLRPPMKGGDVDYRAMNALVDAFMERGGSFFDTAYTYLNGKSEEAIRRCKSCERNCPQHLPVSSHIPKVASVFG